MNLRELQLPNREDVEAFMREKREVDLMMLDKAIEGVVYGTSTQENI